MQRYADEQRMEQERIYQCRNRKSNERYKPIYRL